MKTNTLKIIEYAYKLNLKNVAEDNELLDSFTSLQIKAIEKFLKYEIDVKNALGRERRLKDSHLPKVKKLADFNIGFNKKITRAQLNQLAELYWVDDKYNIIFVGGTGTGKTHIAVALGYIAIDSGYKVIFTKYNELIELLNKKTDVRNKQARLKKFAECDLMIIDEMGYLPEDKAEANSLYKFLSSANGNMSIILTTNFEFSRWNDNLDDEVLATAIIDRLAHKCQVISTKGNSYRAAHHKGIFEPKKQTRSNKRL